MKNPPPHTMYRGVMANGLIQWFSNWGIVTPQPEKPCSCPLKGRSGGHCSDVITMIVLLLATNWAWGTYQCLPPCPGGLGSPEDPSAGSLCIRTVWKNITTHFQFCDRNQKMGCYLCGGRGYSSYAHGLHPMASSTAAAAAVIWSREGGQNCLGEGLSGVGLASTPRS